MIIMKAHVYDITGHSKGEVSLKIFSENVRKDLIKRAYLSERSRKIQPYGPDPIAGQRTSAHYHGRRGIKHSMMNREMARMKRVHGSGYLHMTARFVPQAVKGRMAHPPKPEKIWEKRINRKEWKKALLSAMTATTKKEYIAERGHMIEKVKDIPLIFEDKFEEIKKTKEIAELMIKMGLKEEMERLDDTKSRAGRGKARGRKKITRKGPLIIVSNKSNLKAGKNMAGFDMVKFKDLKVENLAPGAVPGRLCIWTESAIKDAEEFIAK